MGKTPFQYPLSNWYCIAQNKQKNWIMLKLLKRIALLLILANISLTACTSVKGYQKMYLNDPCMALEANKLDFFETNFQTYREGASGSNGGKVGGGCGCN